MGVESLNLQVREIAEIAVEAVPGAQLTMTPKPGADQRTYKADFSKFSRTFPDFEFQWTARKGAQELYEAFRSIALSIWRLYRQALHAAALARVICSRRGCSMISCVGEPHSRRVA